MIACTIQYSLCHKTLDGIRNNQRTLPGNEPVLFRNFFPPPRAGKPYAPPSNSRLDGDGVRILPAWKLWRGNTWYSLSLLFLLSITIVFLIISALTLILDSSCVLGKDTSLALGWLCIVYYIIAAPANIIVACSIGLIGKHFTNKIQN